MRKFKDEFSVSLDNVDRAWLRRPLIVLLIVPALVACLIVGIFEACTEVVEFVHACW